VPSGLVRTDEDERDWTKRMTAQLDRRDKLAEAPQRASGWVVEETGQTYREVWPDGDHRQLLIDKGIRFVLNAGNPINFELHEPE
jgi:site-specific DNA recombinase